MVNSYMLIGCNSCLELSHAWTIPQKLTSSIFMDSITKIMYTCIPKLKLGDRFFFDTPQGHILHICVCPSYVQVVPSNFKQKMYHVMVQRTVT